MTEPTTRLDLRVVALPDVGSRSRARRVIEQGKVTVDGAVVTDPGRMVPPTAQVAIAWNKPGTGREATQARAGLVTAGLVLLHEDKRILAFDKPVGLLTDSASTEQARYEDSLRKRAKAWLKSRGLEAHVVHRIDRDTSGVVLIACDEAAREQVMAQFRARTPERVYDAVVHGRVKADQATWTDWMAWDRAQLVQRPCAPDHPDAFRAQAHMTVVERFQNATWIRVSLVSGRRNQIRLQSQLRGHPLVGERLYLPEGWRAPARPTLGRQALHARRITIAHPDTGAPLTVEAPWPRDLHELVASLPR